MGAQEEEGETNWATIYQTRAGYFRKERDEGGERLKNVETSKLTERDSNFVNEENKMREVSNYFLFFKHKQTAGSTPQASIIM